MSAAIPKYSLQFSLPAEVKDEGDIKTTLKTVSQGADIPVTILDRLEDVSLCCLFALATNNFSKASLHLRFSKKGLEIETTNDKIKAFFLENIKLKTEQAIEFDFEFSTRVYESKKEKGTNTGFFRFLFPDLERFKKDSEIGIVGPGLLEMEGKFIVSPQFVEIYSRFPEAHYSLFDNDSEVLTTLRDQLHSLKFALYDVSMLNKYCRQTDLNEKYRTLFSKMQKNMNDLDLNAKKDKKNTQKAIAVNPDKIKICECEILSSEMPKARFDLIVATFSITTALQEGKKDTDEYLKVLAKFLMALKVGGTLYIDAHIINIYENAEKNPIKRYLEYLMGSELEVRKIQNDFLPNSKEDFLSFDHFETKDISIGITTTSLITIMRKQEKKFSEEEISSIKKDYRAVLSYNESMKFIETMRNISLLRK